jgi:hypothetical protein
MKHYKLFSAATMLCMIAFFTMSWAPSPTATPAPVKSTPVRIIATFTDVSTPTLFTGTFTTSGALNISGNAIMVISDNANGKRAHCVLTLTASDGTGTITIHQQCQFATVPPKGRWEIASGTGAYWDLKGNGSLLMPGNDEDMTGVIY